MSEDYKIGIIVGMFLGIVLTLLAMVVVERANAQTTLSATVPESEMRQCIEECYNKYK